MFGQCIKLILFISEKQLIKVITLLRTQYLTKQYLLFWWSREYTCKNKVLSEQSLHFMHGLHDHIKKSDASK